MGKTFEFDFKEENMEKNFKAISSLYQKLQWSIFNSKKIIVETEDNTRKFKKMIIEW